MPNPPAEPVTIERRVGDFLAFAFTIVILIYAVGGPISDGVRWIIGIFAADAGLLPSSDPIDVVIFPLASAVALYITWRMFGSFIAAFCLFWVIYMFIRGDIPAWAGILQGVDVPFDQNLRAMVQNF